MNITPFEDQIYVKFVKNTDHIFRGDLKQVEIIAIGSGVNQNKYDADEVISQLEVGNSIIIDKLPDETVLMDGEEFQFINRSDIQAMVN
jgi:co-chaperonin GroES (HSP10)